MGLLDRSFSILLLILHLIDTWSSLWSISFSTFNSLLTNLWMLWHWLNNLILGSCSHSFTCDHLDILRLTYSAWSWWHRLRKLRQLFLWRGRLIFFGLVVQIDLIKLLVLTLSLISVTLVWLVSYSWIMCLLIRSHMNLLAIGSFNVNFWIPDLWILLRSLDTSLSSKILWVREDLTIHLVMLLIKSVISKFAHILLVIVVWYWCSFLFAIG